MQYKTIKDQLPTHIIVGYIKSSVDLQVQPITGDQEHINRLLKSSSSYWQSLTIFEFPKEPIVDYGEKELSELRKSEEEREKNRNRYELYLRLKEEFEPNVLEPNISEKNV